METETSDTFWRDYITEAMSFAVLEKGHPMAWDEAYFGLLEELGEVAGVFKRMARGDNGGELDREKLTKELGDLLWYTVRVAFLASNVRQPVLDIFAHEKAAFKPEDLRQLWRKVQQFTEAGRSNRSYILFCIATFAGLDLREVATKNLEKLRARKQAGTIQGSGDNR